jgi:CelD/BcsL family acetyltransferase involved in cellulose biosynthesis
MTAGTNRPAAKVAIMTAETAETMETARLRLTVVSDLDQAAAAALWARAATASVFNHPVWWAAALAAFGVGRRLSVLRVTHADGGQLVGLWPLWEKRLGPKEGFVRILEPVGARVTDYVMPLIDAAADQAAVMQQLFAGVYQQLGGSSVFLWSKMPVGKAAAKSVEQSCSDLGLLSFTRERPCPVMELPASYAELQQRWSKSHRGDVRRQVKRLAEKGPSWLFVARTRSEILARLPHLYTMHTKNWGTRTGFSEFERGPMAIFVAQLASEMPLELLHYSELRLNNQALSCHFGFCYGTSQRTTSPGRTMRRASCTLPVPPRLALLRALTKSIFCRGLSPTNCSGQILATTQRRGQLHGGRHIRFGPGIRRFVT